MSGTSTPTKSRWKFRSPSSKPSSLDGRGWRKTSLDLIKEAAPLCAQVPYIGVLAGIALKLVEVADRVESNQTNIDRLARKAAAITITIMDPFQDTTEEDIDPRQKTNLERDIQKLTCAMIAVLEFAESSVGRGKLNRLWRLGGDQERLSELEKELDDAITVFSVGADVRSRVASAIIISSVRRQRSLSTTENGLPTNNSTYAFVKPALPLPPSLVVAQEREIDIIVETITKHPGSNVCITGGPGDGKTTMALAVLHHETIIKRCGDNRFWIPCDAANSAETLLGVIAASLCVEANIDAIVTFFKRGDISPGHPNLDSPGGDGLCILDNFDSAWDTGQLQAEAESLLARLTTLEQLHILITLRGDVTPAKSKWAKVRVPSLDVGSAAAIFVEHSGRDEDLDFLHELLIELDCHPHTVALIAQTAKASVSIDAILKQWRSKKSEMLSATGRDRLSNLDVSVEISLNSPRMRMAPSGVEAIRLLSILPGGTYPHMLAKMLPRFKDEDVNDAVIALMSVGLVEKAWNTHRYSAVGPVKAYMQNHHPVGTDDWTSVGQFYLSWLRDQNWGGFARNSEVDYQEFENVLEVYLYLLRRSILGDEIMESVRQLRAYILRKNFFSEDAFELYVECLRFGQKVDRPHPHNFSRSDPLVTGTATSLRPDSVPVKQEWPYIGCLEPSCKDMQIEFDIIVTSLKYSPRRRHPIPHLQCVQSFERIEHIARTENLPHHVVSALIEKASCKLDTAQTVTDFEDVWTILQEALEFAAEHGLKTGEVEALLALGNLCRIMCAPASVRQQYEHALQLCAELGDKTALGLRREANALLGLGMAELVEGPMYVYCEDAQRTADRLQKASDIFTELGERERNTMCIIALAQVEISKWTASSRVAAEDMLGESAWNSKMRRWTHAHIYALISHARMNYFDDAWEAALELLEKCQTLKFSTSDRNFRGFLFHLMALCQKGIGMSLEALENFENAKTWYTLFEPEWIPECDAGILATLQRMQEVGFPIPVEYQGVVNNETAS